MKTIENNIMDDLKTICSKRLTSFDGNITAQDKLDAMEFADISRPTLDKYLNGDVPKIETATKLIQFFEGKVRERMKELI